MARRNPAQLQFDALALEGALLPPEWLAKVAALEASVQSPADYGIPKGLQLRDEIGRYWRIAEAIWGEFAAARNADPVGAARRLARDLLTQVFAFADLTPAGERTVDARVFPLAFEALGGRVPVVVGPPTESMDQSVPRHGDGNRRRSAWGVLQEYLNATDAALWGLATNGATLRLGRDNASLTRPAWLEADLERIFTEQRFADFSVLWLLLHASRFGRADQPPPEAPLERWREAGREEGSRAREALRLGVEDALRTLGQGFVADPANMELRAALASGALSPADYFNELLRLVYRMIFLLTVEERGILHAPDAPANAVALYASGYGMRRLRERALRHSAHDRHRDLWASLRPVFAALGRAEGEPALGLPGLGGLFAVDQCPHLDAASLENRALLTAVFRLAWLREEDALARVNWKDMGVEEFGSVYESLLELVPVVNEGGRHFGFAGEGGSVGNARKLTGSYYTPDALVQQLLDTALEPVVSQRLTEHPHARDAERALLSLAVVDPACGSGHFLLAAARRLAGHLARLRAGGTPGAAEYRYALRDVVTHCIHGVDRNPMALELARMALWLEAYTPDRALGFLDHHLVCGDALLGLLDLGALKAGIPDEAFKALTGDDKDVAKTLTKLNRAGRKALEERQMRGQLALELGTQTLAEAFVQLDELADDGLAGVEAKRTRYAALRAESAASPLALAADIFVGSFLMPKRLTSGERALTEQQAAGRFPTTAALAMALEGTLAPTHPVAVAARMVCGESRVLHWPLAFPQVFARGGFDVVLGNPPWERIKLQEQEFFAARAPQVASARNKAEREREITKLANAPEGTPERAVYDDFVHAKQLAEAASVFCHAEARYALTGVGDVNTYALFAETMLRMTLPAGRTGAIVPTGIATDDSTKDFFEMVANGRVVSLLDFRTGPGLFSEIGHQRYKFCLLTLGPAGAAEYAFGLTEVGHLRDRRRRFTLRAEDFLLVNPNTRTCPTFRTERDAELTRKIHRRVKVLVNEQESEGGDSWSFDYMTKMFDMADSSAAFRTYSELMAVGARQIGGCWLDDDGVEWVPLYEAKMIHQLDHRWATFETDGVSDRRLSDQEKADEACEPLPRYWVPRQRTCERLRTKQWQRSWLMGWRDIARSTDERTVISSFYPAVGVGHTIRNMFVGGEPAMAAFLVGALSSLVVDYVARQKVGGTHLTVEMVKQLPIPSATAVSQPDLDFVVPRVLELSFTSRALEGLARDLGYDGPPFRWDPDRRALLRAELDAYYARLYGLTRDELRYILDPADVMGPDYPSETFRVLKQNEQRQYGEYRTRRLVLEAYDALVARRPMPGELAAALEMASQPHALVPPRPQLDPSAARALAVIALVRAAGGALPVPELARALVLRSQPSDLPRHAPAASASVAKAWARHAETDPLPPGTLLALLDLLVDRQALRWQPSDTGARVVATTDYTAMWDERESWFRTEAHLLLDVLRAMPPVALDELDSQVPVADRMQLHARTA